jgi:hypothetical protein
VVVDPNKVRYAVQLELPQNRTGLDTRDYGNFFTDKTSAGWDAEKIP